VTEAAAPDRPARVLAIGAHPDDVEFFAGATVARLRASGAEVTIAICTDGARGSVTGVANLAALRRGEAQQAAAALGGVALAPFGFPDGDLAPDDALRKRLVREIRTRRPELVLVHDPATLWLDVGELARFGHSDHRAAGQAALDAIYPRAGLASFYPEQVAAGLGPWFVRHVWLFDTTRPDHFVPRGEFAQHKRAALRCHETQGPEMLLRESEEQARLWAERAGEPAEAFRRLRLL
jgi:LmbE family N-acetylglucosaminyl deacetylase